MMEATQTDTPNWLCYPVHTHRETPAYRARKAASLVLGAGRDLLHTTADHPDKLLDGGVQVADPYYHGKPS